MDLTKSIDNTMDLIYPVLRILIESSDQSVNLICQYDEPSSDTVARLHTLKPPPPPTHNT
jgi:hypothetical protein